MSSINSMTIITKDKNITIGRNDIRATIWFIASILYEVEGLQHFASTVSPTEPLDIKSTAEILAKAQLELRNYHNNR